MAGSDLIRRGQRPAVPVVFAPFQAESPTAPAAEAPPPAPAVLIEQARARAEADGYAAGYARGRQAAEAELRAQIERLRQLAANAVHDVRSALLQLEPQVIELALTVAGRVIERELADHPEIVADVVRAALTAAGTLPVVRVRINPADRPFVEPIWDTICPPAGDPPIELVSDPEVQAGGCVIDTASGFVDAQPRTRLDELRMQVLPILEGGR
ncbi:MAG: hypothetical protein IRY83_06330 [Chloroflexi bacterium]|nr:hypothetical protein [Chloroflexota bacterium]